MNRQKLIDFLAMSRFANLPTVWSNALLGSYLSIGLFGSGIAQLPYLLLSLSCLYLGGCFLNDWYDVAFDTKYKSDRPIPSGRWTRKSLGILAFLFLGGGLLLGALISATYLIFATAILLCILGYTRWHKKNIYSLFLMAGARALIYPACALGPLTWQEFTILDPNKIPVILVLSLCLGSYILGISLLARYEARSSKDDDDQAIIPILCLSLPAILITGLLAISGHPLSALIPFAIFIAVLNFTVKRLRKSHDIGAFVSWALAAIPLLDSLFLMRQGINALDPSLILVCPLLALLALGLQKIAPAT